jgi:hypothetical protein
LDTRIGEQGLSLSGGQRQRLALARAVLGRPPVLVLDDPLSALDVHTEAEVEAALRRVLGGVTALVVAHRSSTVQLADRVAMLRDGVIAAVGTHRELLASDPEYRALLASTDSGGCGRVTAVDDGWRGVAKRGRRARPRRRRAPSAGAGPAAPRHAHPAAPAGGGGGAAAARRAERGRAGGPLLVAYAIDTGIPGRGGGRRWARSSGRSGATRHGRGVGGVPRGLPAAHRADRAGRAPGRAAAGVRPRPAALARLPRAVHLRSLHLAPHQRRRRAERPAGEGPGRLRRRRCSQLVGISVLLVWLDPRWP